MKKNYSFIVMFLIIIHGLTIYGNDSTDDGAHQSKSPLTFSLVSHTPSINALNVSLTTKITLFFNNDVNTGTLAGNIRIFGRETGLYSWTYSYNPTDFSVTLTPTGKSLKPGEKLTTIVTTGVKNSSGTSLDKACVWSFTLVVSKNYQSFVKVQDDIVLSGWPRGSALSDFNNDGDLDLVFACHESGTAEILENDGTGHFTWTTTLSGNGLSWATYSPKVFDFENDGDNDIAIPSRFQACISLWKNNGSGVFIANGRVQTHTEPQYIIPGDFNGDGFMDFAVLCNTWNYQCMDIFFNDKSGAFNIHQTLYPSPQGERQCTAGIAMDVENDQDLDIILDFSSINLLRNDGTGTFSSTSYTGLQGVYPNAGDFTGDGYEDLCGGNRTVNQTQIINNISGILTLGPIYNINIQQSNIVKDITGDGFLDFIAKSYQENAMVLFTNDGTGNFTSQKIIEGYFIGGEENFLCGDIDGDGDLDVVSEDQQRVYVFKGTGYDSTTFTGTGDWHDPVRWDNGIPDQGKIAIIDGLCNITGSANCFDLIINTGRELSVNNSLTCRNVTLKDGASVLGNSNITMSGITRIERYVHGTWSHCNSINDSVPITTSDELHFVSSPLTDASDSIVEQDAVHQWLEPFQYWKWLHHSCNEPCLEPPGIWNPGMGYSIVSNSQWYLTTPCQVFHNPLGYCVEPWKTQHYREFIGTMNSGDVHVSLTYTTPPAGSYAPGWNLLGNPYPSAIDWELVSSSNVYVNSACFWNPSSGGYIYAAGQSGFIPITQGFFVQCAAGGGSVTFGESARIHNNNAPVWKSTKTDLLILHIGSNVNSYWDETYVVFNPEATAGFDLYDGAKLGNLPEAPMLYSLSSDYNFLAYNSLPSIKDNPLVPVYFRAGATGTFSINAKGMESFGNNTPVYLEDIELGTYQDLRQNPVYTFTAGSAENSHRFNLHFSGVGFGNHNYEGINIYSYNNDVFVNVPSNVTGKISILNLLGMEIVTEDIVPGLLNKIPLSVSTGYYLVKVSTNTNVVAQKVFIK